MPRGGIRPRRIDGSTDHLLKPKWKSGQTRTIRVPKVLAEQLLEIAHKLDSGESLELTQDKNTDGISHPVEVTQDNRAEVGQIKADLAKAIALLQNAITPKTEGGSLQRQQCHGNGP